MNKVDALDRCLAGEATPSDRELIARWLGSEPSPASVLRTPGEQVPSPEMTERGWAEMSQRLADAAAPSPVAPGRWSRVPKRGWVSLAAGGMAAVLVVVGLAAGVAQYRSAHADGLAQPQVFSTANAQRTTIHLADGTSVTLNVASRLEVPATFGVRDRTVHLDGEAVFDVRNTKSTPFIIRTGTVSTTVLGTEFGVRAYAQDSAVQVAVQSGRVSVDGVTLSAQDVGQFASSGITVRRGQDVGAMLGFASGRLVLTGAPLRTVLPDLERWYDAEIQLADASLGEQRLQTVLGVGSRNDLAQILEFLLQARVSVHGHTVVVHSR